MTGVCKYRVGDLPSSPVLLCRSQALCRNDGVVRGSERRIYSEESEKRRFPSVGAPHPPPRYDHSALVYAAGNMVRQVVVAVGRGGLRLWLW